MYYHQFAVVSIIVPNYNHESYLRQRLDSIYSQTYQNFEVLLMDDCSTDNSKKILSEYALRHQNNTRTRFNEVKANSISEQWRKGILVSRGQLIWIAESDDWCTLNFLEVLVPLFENHEIKLAYCNTRNMNQDGEIEVGSIQEYLRDIDKDKWNHSFTQSAEDCVQEAFSIKNIIPNASGVLFRKPTLSLLNNKKWIKFCYCGDWFFYLNLICGELITYTMEATNYFRMHEYNHTHAGFRDKRFYTEHENICQFLKKNYIRVVANIERVCFYDLLEKLFECQF